MPGVPAIHKTELFGKNEVETSLVLAGDLESPVTELGTVDDYLSESGESEHSWCEVLAQLGVSASF